MSSAMSGNGLSGLRARADNAFHICCAPGSGIHPGRYLSPVALSSSALHDKFDRENIESVTSAKSVCGWIRGTLLFLPIGQFEGRQQIVHGVALFPRQFFHQVFQRPLRYRSVVSLERQTDLDETLSKVSIVSRITSIERQ